MNISTLPFRAGSLAASIALVLALAPAQQADAALVSVTDGNTTFQYEENDEGGDAFMPNWTIGGTDVLFNQTFYFNGTIDFFGTPTEIAVSEGNPDPADDFNSATAEVNQLQVGGVAPAPGEPNKVVYTAAPNNVFITVQYTLSDDGAGNASILEEYNILNASIGPVTMDLFVYADSDLGASAGDDTGTFNASRDVFTQTDDGGSGQTYRMHSSVSGADIGVLTGLVGYHTAIAPFSSLVDSLDNSTITTAGEFTGLDASVGNTFSGDVTVGFMYQLLLGFGEQISFSITKTAFVPPVVTGVPEPASIALLGAGGLALVGVSRRRRSRYA